MVRSMRHDGPQAGPERTSSVHSIVCKGGGAEETTAHGGGDEGEFGAGLRGIRGTYKYFLAFRYLGRALTAGEDDWIAVVGNLGKARNSWGRLSGVLGREGTDPKVSGNLYKAVAQEVLLFGSEMWVLTKRMEKALYSFQYKVARRLTGN